MYVFTVQAISETASFRIPESQTFHQTLPLPPVTTLVGMVGAAVGLSFEDAMQFRDDRGIRLGVCGRSNGKMRDLWKYRKVKPSQVIPAVLIREILTGLRITVAIGSESADGVSLVRTAFANPRYALTAGTSDDLLKVLRLSPVQRLEPRACHTFQDTVLPGDQSANCLPDFDLKETPITETIRSPDVFLLPTEFVFDEAGRRVSRREHFTFIGSPVKLKEPLSAYHIAEESLVLL